MSRQRNKRWAGFFLALLMLFEIAAGSLPVVYAAEDLPAGYAAGREHHVRDFYDLLGLAAQSQTLDFENETIYLDTSIEITPIEQAVLDKYGIKHLTFGNKDCRFKGTFDGQGNTIKGLEYQKTILPDQNCGLFSYAQNAVIKNLTIEDAKLESVYQGGIVVGQAKNCVLENITVLNSDIEVKPANNVVSLVTNGGFCGGGIAGLIEDSVMYNCEISGTVAHCNITAGVAALGGEGLYMGGLVGWASNSTIEYCRARSNYAPDGTVRQSRVKNHYDTAVGALGGKNLYVGGIVGGVNNGCRIYDCFSTAELYFYAANYVSVGSGTAGYGGGIVGALRGGSLVERCHYAGDISSMQYNAILVIPIIQKNVNICGVARLLEDGSQVIHSFFRPSDIVSGAQIPAAGSKDNELHYPVGDEEYQDVNFWEEKDYDFEGSVQRVTNTHNKQPHVNKWVMDYDLGIPVHGNSVSATFDFPEAGSVTVEKTMLVNRAVTTEDPLSFAVQGVHPREKQEVNLLASLKDRYQLVGWYKKAGVTQHGAASIDTLLDITADAAAKLPQQGTQVTVPVQDNDLIVAAVKGLVTFYQVNGDFIQEEGYRYGELLRTCEPTAPADPGAKFYGWTTVPNNAVAGEKGYSAITSTQLNDIMQQNALYQAGDRVEKQMELYPIFINSLTNILTQFEGHEQDGLDDPTRRENVGHTIVAVDEAGAYIDVTGENADGSFPEGYRFKGWYQQLPDGHEVKVSREQKYYVPALTGTTTYVARFEYGVGYWARAYEQNNSQAFAEPALFATLWYSYQEPFRDISGPAFHDENVIGWGKENVNHGKDYEGVCTEKYTPENLLITQPMNVYSHNSHSKGSVSNNYGVFADTDFPGAGDIHSYYGDSALRTELEFTPLSDRYIFHFWTLEQMDGAWSYANRRFDTGAIHVGVEYKARVMASTLVDFYGKEGAVICQVGRRYHEPLLGAGSTYTYYYPHYHTDTVVNPNTEDHGTIQTTFTSAASPSNEQMEKTGYQFMGWIDSREVPVDSFAWKYLYDVAADPFCTSDIERVKPYLVQDTDLVTQTTALYPVYAKYTVETTTNVHLLANRPGDVQLPGVPAYTLDSTGMPLGKAKITLSAESGKTPVLVSAPDGARYKLVYMVCQVDGTEKKLTLAQTNAGDYVYTGEITAGKNYRFIAHYSPLMLMYHMDDQNTVQTVVREAGEKVGAMPQPNYAAIANVAGRCFVGWTETQPENGVVHRFDEKAQMETAGIVLVNKNQAVKGNMNLWPVFVSPSVMVNSNIDTVIVAAGDAPQEYRSLQSMDGNRMQLTARDYPGYKFVGWYAGYVDKDHQGSLLSEKAQLPLTQAQLFEEKTYTAVFQKAVQVRYHLPDGTLLHVENVLAGTRSFVDDTGAALDTEPILALQEKLAKNQFFNQWQWNDGGQLKQWKQFCTQTIVQDMDIYPELSAVTVTDSQNNSYTGRLDFRLVQSQKIDPSSAPDSYTLAGLFTEEYTQPFLTLAIFQVSYSPEMQGIQETPVVALPTRMYVNRQAGDEQKLVEASQGPVLSDQQGKARHDFFGRLALTKSYADTSISGQVFIQITPEADPQAAFVIPVDVNSGTGTVTLNLPVGKYILTEDEAWNWRDTATFTGGGASGEYTVTMGTEQAVSIQNERTNPKWFDGETHKKNKKA